MSVRPGAAPAASSARGGFRCKRCGAEIPAADVDAQRLIAKCRACHTLFDAYNAPDGAPLPASRRPAVTEHAVTPPPDVFVELGERPVPAGYRVAPGGVGTPLCISFPANREVRREGCGCLVFIGTLSLAAFVIADGHVRGAAAWILGAVCVIFVYYVFASAFDVTTVTADDTWLRVSTGPLPLPLPRVVEVDSRTIARLFVVSRGRSSTAFSVLVASLLDGSERRLLVSDSGEDLLFVAKAVERRLGLGSRLAPG